MASGVHVMLRALRMLGAWEAATWGYVLRSLLATSLALWLGFQLHLDSPFSAASTVLLLIHPLQGAVVGKGFHRALGTLVGLAVALVLTSLFAQQMLLFILGIGVWLGLCVGAMTVFRHYQATAAVVAGYTVCLALGPAIVAPQQGFEHIVGRGTAVVLGVLSLSLVATLFSRKTVERTLTMALRDVSSRTLRLLAVRFDGGPARAQDPLAIDISKVDDLLGIGRGESVLIRARLATLQAGLAYLHAVVLDECAIPSHAGIGAQLRQLAEAMPGFCVAADRVRELQASLEPGASQRRLNEPLAELASALSSFACLERAPLPPARAVGFHRHYGAALRNGVRALLATLATGAVWYLTGWDQGPTLLAVLGPFCTLLATSAAPEQGIASLARGTFYAILAAAGCKFLLLPHISGFGLLTVVLVAFWAVGIHATTRPRHALQGVAYLITFNTLVGTAGTAQYDFADFVNQALAWMVTLAICLLAFQLLPGKPASHADVLRTALHKDTRQLLRRWHRMDLLKWQATQQHRMVALQALSGADEAGAVSLQLGRQLRLLHRKTRDLEPDSSIARCVQAGDRRIARYAFDSAISAAQARRTSRSLIRLGARDLAACYRDLARLLDQYQRADIRTSFS